MAINNFIINLHECYVTELGFELVTLGSAVRCYRLGCVTEKRGWVLMEPLLPMYE